MKTLGLIGGVGPESTIEYYRLLIAGYRQRTDDGAAPAIIINSVDVQLLLKWMTANELEKVINYLVSAIEKLEQAGVDFAAIAANTPHIVFDAIQGRTKLRLISIVEAAREKTESLGLKVVGLLGTRFTMSATFYPEVFSRGGIRLVVPSEEQQAYIHEKYVSELLNDVFLPETRARLLSIAADLRSQHGVEAIILGGTELPLLLRDEERDGIRFLDTTRIHVERIVDELLV